MKLTHTILDLDPMTDFVNEMEKMKRTSSISDQMTRKISLMKGNDEENDEENEAGVLDS